MDDLVVENTNSGTGAGISIIANATNGYSNIGLGDTDDKDVGRIQYNHAENSLALHVNASERMRIDSSGNLSVGGTSPSTQSAKLQTRGTSQDATRINMHHEGNSSASISANGGLVFGSDTSNGTTERMRIDSSGRLLLGTTTEGHADADNFTVSGSGNTGITIRSTDSGESNLFFSDGTSGADEYRGIIRYEHNNNALVFKTNTTLALTLDISQNATFAGTVSDSKGELRTIPLNINSTGYTLVAADAGKAVTNTSGGWTVNNSIFSAGQAVTLINNGSGDQTITQGSGVTIYNTADAATGNRTLAARGMATLIFYNASSGYISGAVLT